jgi:hypothetical protein
LHYIYVNCPTAGVTGKGGNWWKKPPDAESASWGRLPESAAERPHLSGARDVGQVLQDGFDFNILTVCIGVLVGNLAANQNDD